MPRIPLGVLEAETSSDQMTPLLSRAYGRATPVTRWRQDLAGLTDQVANMIHRHDDPERQLLTAREVAEDIVHAVKLHLQATYGRVFDPVFDGRGHQS